MNELQKSIISILQKKKQCSNKELASILSVTRAAISQATAPMLEEGYLSVIGEIQTPKAGRKEKMLTINPDSFFSIGVDIDGSVWRYIEIDGMQKTKEDVSFSSADDVLSHIQERFNSSCVGIAISEKSFYRLDQIQGDKREFFEALSSFSCQKTYVNNISALAYSHKLSHPEDENFVLVKYGPGVGSAFFIGNRLLQSNLYPSNEMGKIILGGGKTVEETIGYFAFSNSKEEAIIKLKNEKKTRRDVLSVLATVSSNINTLLQLDKILISGDIFQSDEIFVEFIDLLPLCAEEKKKFTRMENYKELNQKKAALTAQYLYLSSK